MGRNYDCDLAFCRRWTTNSFCTTPHYASWRFALPPEWSPFFAFATASLAQGASRLLGINWFCSDGLMHPLPGSFGKSRNLRRIVVAATAMLALAGCGSKNTYVPPPPPKVVVAQPLQQPVTLYIELTGNTEPLNTVTLVARVEGYLETIDYEDGAAVKKGTLLFGIERDTYQAKLDAAKGQLARDQAALEEARMNLARYQKLQQQQSIAAQQAEDQVYNVQQAEAAVMVDQANVDTASINLGFTRVLAPFDGIVTNHQADIGALVGVSGPTTLATIVQTDPLYVYFTVSEPQVLAIRRARAEAGRPISSTDISSISNIPVEIGLQNEEGYPHKGHLDYVSPQVNTATGTLTARGLFENNDQRLLPGLFVRVRLPIAHQNKALLTRNDAIGTNQEGSYVLVVGADNVVTRKIVKLGQKQGQLRIVESGLDAGDWIVTEGTQRAFPGDKVEPQRSELTAGTTDTPNTPQTNAPTPAPK
jgi:multidrug efflux system membrane fusion protein